MTCRHLFGDSPHCVRCYERRDATDHTFTDVLALAGAMGSAPSPHGAGPIGPTGEPSPSDARQRLCPGRPLSVVKGTAHE